MNRPWCYGVGTRVRAAPAAAWEEEAASGSRSALEVLRGLASPLPATPRGAGAQQGNVSRRGGESCFVAVVSGILMCTIGAQLRLIQ